MWGKALSSMVIMAGIFSFESVGRSQSDSPTWLAFGDLRGYLEPCGCDPRTDLGGLKRLASYIQRERAMGRQTLVMSLGNNLPVPVPDPSKDPSVGRDSRRSLVELKAPFFNEALLEIRPDAALANVTEISWVLRNQDPPPGTPLGSTPPGAPPSGSPPLPEGSARLGVLMVLSNATDSFDSKQLTKPFISVSGRALVLGYTWDGSLSSALQPPSTALAKKWRTILRQNDPKGHGGGRRRPSGSHILLFSGPDDHLKEILKWRLFDLVISSNRAPLSQEPGIEERANPAKLLRHVKSGRHHGQSEQEILMVPLGGQGILRGGKARQLEAKPLAEIFAKSPTTPAPVQLISGGNQFVTWLDSAQDSSSHFEDLFSRYRVAVAQQFENRAQQRLIEYAATPYAGAESCKGCHPTAYEAWSKSNHAKAYETLLKKSAHKDGECISCHVVGGEAVGGFVSAEASPGLAGVQCENCHGPRKAHTLLPLTKPASEPRSVCVSCHKLPHSSQFKFEDYWPRIKHGK